MAKTRIDLEVKDIKDRGDTVKKIMGEVLEVMTKTSRDRIEKYAEEPLDDEELDALETHTLDEERTRGLAFHI